MRLHFKGVRELHTNIIHSEKKLSSLSYLLSVRNSPVSSIYNLNSNINTSMEGGNVLQLPRGVSGKRKVSKHWFTKMVHHQTHMEEVFCKFNSWAPPREPAFIGDYGRLQEHAYLTSPSSQ